MESLQEFLEMKKYYLDIVKEKDQRIAELEQDLEFTTKTANALIEIKHKLEHQLAEKDIRIEELEGQFAYECECNKQLVELQKQLEEKQNTIDEINKEFVQAVHDWKALCAEKDKEIEEKMMSFEKRCQEYYKSDEFKRDFAIQELEKVQEDCFIQKELVDFGNVACFMVDIADILEIINNQIKELKGEKDDTDK